VFPLTVESVRVRVALKLLKMPPPVMRKGLLPFVMVRCRMATVPAETVRTGPAAWPSRVGVGNFGIGCPRG